VAALSEPGIVRITYPTSGHNPEFRILRHPALAKKTTRGKGKSRAKRLEAALLTPYLAENYTLADFAFHPCFVAARFTRQGRHLWTSFIFSDPKMTSDMIVVEWDVSPHDEKRLRRDLAAVQRPILDGLPATCQQP
jgi:glutathione S-transferase